MFDALKLNWNHIRMESLSTETELRTYLSFRWWFSGCSAPYQLRRRYICDANVNLIWLEHQAYGQLMERLSRHLHYCLRNHSALNGLRMCLKSNYFMGKCNFNQLTQIAEVFALDTSVWLASSSGFLGRSSLGSTLPVASVGSCWPSGDGWDSLRQRIGWLESLVRKIVSNLLILAWAVEDVEVITKKIELWPRVTHHFNHYWPTTASTVISVIVGWNENTHRTSTAWWVRWQWRKIGMCVGANGKW